MLMRGMPERTRGYKKSYAGGANCAAPVAGGAEAPLFAGEHSGEVAEAGVEVAAIEKSSDGPVGFGGEAGRFAV